MEKKPIKEWNIQCTVVLISHLCGSQDAITSQANISGSVWLLFDLEKFSV